MLSFNRRSGVGLMVAAALLILGFIAVQPDITWQEGFSTESFNFGQEALDVPEFEPFQEVLEPFELKMAQEGFSILEDMEIHIFMSESNPIDQSDYKELMDLHSADKEVEASRLAEQLRDSETYAGSQEALEALDWFIIGSDLWNWLREYTPALTDYSRAKNDLVTQKIKERYPTLSSYYE